ncbi:Zinc finger protein [Pseudolycoriella hygida]|uniref:Zinc finger protein n=1 Tax=Pseudolycoriella hygida TaxID=35572 RepID=A0A9Q0MRY3_9DIPT|nr:Zinc finger protein [Pseudolycoriella hygida]
MTDFQFVNTDNFDQGSLKPLSENRYFCAICDRKLNDVRLTDDELERFKTNNGFNCNICFKLYRSINSLKDHQIEHFNGNELKVACVECTNLSKTLDAACEIVEIGEIYTKNDVRSEYYCETCDRCFDDKNKYKQHIRDHYDRIVYTCDDCNGTKIIGWERWNIHRTTTHENTELTPSNLSYKCSVCAIVICNISEFQKHLSCCQSTNIGQPVNLNDGDSVYCGICCVEMPDIKAVEQKLRTQTTETDYFRTSFDALNCLMCHKVFLSNGDLLDHQKKDHFESRYENRFACVRCINKANKFACAASDAAITNATSFASKDKTFCSMCGKFIKVTLWPRHVRNHRDRVVYQCGSCRKIRIGAIRFQNHFRQSPKCVNFIDFHNDKVEKESKSYTYQCVKCKQTFTRRSFKGHVEESDCYKENQCKTCAKRFITKIALNGHHQNRDCVKVESSSKFQCIKCDKFFHTRKGFALHSNVCRRWNERTNRCDICNILIDSSVDHWNDFHRRKSLVQMKRNVDKEMNSLSKSRCKEIQFGCLLCESTFSSRQKLQFHMKTHYCDKAVQTMSEGHSEVDWDLVDTDSKHPEIPHLKDEKIDTPPMAEGTNVEDENSFLFPNAIAEPIKTEFTDDIEETWAANSENFTSFADDDTGDVSDEEATHTNTMSTNAQGMDTCCFCKNVIHDLISADDVVHQQINTFGQCFCMVCFQLFSKFEKLREHEISHRRDNSDGHLIACRLCAWSSNVYFTDADFFRLEKDLQCYMCSTKTSDLRTLRRHKRSHLSLCVFTCKVCNKRSISDERHRSHLRKHQKTEFSAVTNQIVRKCTMCSEEATNLFRDEEEIDEMFEKFGGGPCKICFTYINDKRRYVSHERGHMDEQQLIACLKCCNSKVYTDDEYHQFEDELKCFICDAKLSSKYNLHLHKRKHLDRVVYTCTICSALVVGTKNHSHHMYKHGLRKKNRNEEKGRFECDFCQKVFPHKSSLPAHFKQHLNKERVPCPQCTLTFASKGNLTQHIKQIHLNIRKHICELCGKAFGHPHNLKSHMVKHSGEKPYQCPICFKRFGYYSRMKTHAWIHSGLKPYKCDQCDKAYNDSTDLRRHKRIHGGVEKKFECELCKIKFYEHKYLRAHRASAHKFLVQ